MATAAPTFYSIIPTKETSMRSIFGEQPIETVSFIQDGGDGCQTDQGTRHDPNYPLPQGNVKVCLTSNEDSGGGGNPLEHFDGGIVSEEECECSHSPLDFRVDWSTRHTESVVEWIFPSPIILINTEAQKDEKASEAKFSMDWELKSALSCDEHSDMEDCGSFDDLWGDSLTSSLRSPTTETEPILHFHWVEPEYPEVWTGSAIKRSCLKPNNGRP